MGEEREPLEKLMIFRRILTVLLVLSFLFVCGCDGYLGRSRRVRPDRVETGTVGHRYLEGAGYEQE